MDILRPLRSCFLCKKKDSLLHIVRHPAYDFLPKHYYYHPVCLKKVLCRPEDYLHLVDMALDIAHGVKLEKQQGEYAAERAKRVCVKAKEMCVELYGE